MTGRERVRRAVLFRGPDRVPRALPEPWGTDFLGVGYAKAPGWTPARDGEDEWGCVWTRDAAGVTMGQVTEYPLADYAALDAYRFPDFTIPERYEEARRRVQENDEELFVLASVPVSLIHRLEYLRGHEAAWSDPYDHPEELGCLLDRLADCAIDAIEQFADIGVDGIFSCDDWGLQDRCMVSPEVFRTFWKPRYARVYAAAREHGMLCFLHSCGHIIDLLEDLMEAGVHVIQLDQQENMGLDTLAHRFGGKLCFWCPVDIQQTMVYGDVADVRRYARRMIFAFGRYNGGFMAKWYPSPDSVEHSREKIEAMCEAFIEYGDYAGQPSQV